MSDNVHHLSRPAAELPAAPPPIGTELSAAWERVVTRIGRGGSDFRAADIPAFLVTEAREKAPLYQAALTPAARTHLWAWLERLRALRACQTWPESAGELQASVDGLWTAVGDLPAGCWTQDSLKAWIRQSIHWPLPATLRKHADTIASQLRSGSRVCETIVRASEATPVRVDPGPMPDPARAAHAAAAVQRFTSTRIPQIPYQQAQTGTPRPTPRRGAVVSDEALLATMERDRSLGVRGLDLRITMLRAKLGKGGTPSEDDVPGD